MKVLVVIHVSAYFLLLIKSQRVHGVDNTKVGSFTPEELSKIKQLREMIKAIDDYEYMKSNGYLIRWLRAKNMNVESAHRTLEEAMEWRKDNNVTRILDEEHIPVLAGKQFYSTDAVNKEGYPILTIEVKKLKTKKFVLGGQSKQFIWNYIQMLERVEDKLHTAINSTLVSEKQAAQAIVICDGSEYNLRQHACIGCVSVYFQTINILEQYYPGLFNNIFFINAPRIFGPMFELVKPLFSAGTLKRITISGVDKAEWQPKLLNLISADQLPARFGGTRLN